jgi:TRAP-type C4-dicarboxylate transport system substrate-binding protein
VYAPPTGAIAMQWFTKIKYITDVPLIYLAGGFVVKKNVFNQIPPEYRKVLTESCRQNMDQLKLVVRKENQEALQVMSKHGVKILKPSKDQVMEFRNLSDKAMQRVGDKSFSKKVRDEVEAYLKAFRGENRQ